MPRADPRRLLTLTCDTKLYANPRDAFDRTRRQVPELIKVLREKFGEVEYLRITELTKAGWPHYHLMVRSKFLPREVIQAEWAKLTGNTVIDVRQVQKAFSAYFYLMKYLSKLHQIEWTERHVSYSRNFFRPDPNFKPEPCTLSEKKLHPIHPWLYLHHWWSGQSIQQLRLFTWLVGDRNGFEPDLIDPDKYGLPRSGDQHWIEDHHNKMPPLPPSQEF
jgi:hypothetical protein